MTTLRNSVKVKNAQRIFSALLQYQKLHFSSQYIWV